MGAMASQITSLTVVYSSVYPGADQRKYQSSTSLAFVRGIHRELVNSPHKWPVTRKMFPFDNVIMLSVTMIVKYREYFVSQCWASMNRMLFDGFSSTKWYIHLYMTWISNYTNVSEKLIIDPCPNANSDFSDTFTNSMFNIRQKVMTWNRTAARLVIEITVCFENWGSTKRKCHSFWWDFLSLDALQNDPFQWWKSCQISER